MNDWLEELAQRLADAAEARGTRIAVPELTSEVSAELLELARVAAHTAERRFAPLAAYLAGVAAERFREAGGDVGPDAVSALIRSVREALEAEGPS